MITTTDHISRWKVRQVEVKHVVSNTTNQYKISIRVSNQYPALVYIANKAQAIFLKKFQTLDNRSNKPNPNINRKLKYISNHKKTIPDKFQIQFRAWLDVINSWLNCTKKGVE